MFCNFVWTGTLINGGELLETSRMILAMPAWHEEKTSLPLEAFGHFALTGIAHCLAMLLLQCVADRKSVV